MELKLIASAMIRRHEIMIRRLLSSLAEWLNICFCELQSIFWYIIHKKHTMMLISYFWIVAKVCTLLNETRTSSPSKWGGPKFFLKKCRNTEYCLRRIAEGRKGFFLSLSFLFFGTELNVTVNMQTTTAVPHAPTSRKLETYN